MINTRKKFLSILAVVFFAIMIMNVKSYAATFSVSKTSVSVNKGKTASITVNGKSITGRINVSSSNTSVATVSVGSKWVNKSSFSFKITGKKAGTATITVSGTDFSDSVGNLNSATKTIKVTVKDSSSSSTTSTSDNTNKKKSSDATLSNLGVTPKEYDFKGFKKSVTGSNAEYKVKVPNNVTKLTVYATTTSSKAKYSVSGNTGFKVGTNIISVKVTAEDGTKKTYKIYVTRAAEDDEEVIPNVIDDENSTDDQTSSDSNGIGLDSLKVQGYVLSPEFNSSTYEYFVEIGEQKFESIDEIKNLIEATTSYEEAQAIIDVKEGTEEDSYKYLATIKVSDYEKEYASYTIKFVESLEAADEVGENSESENLYPEDIEAAEKNNEKKDLIFGYDRDFVEKLALAGCSLLLFIIVIVQGILLHKKNIELAEYDDEDDDEREGQEEKTDDEEKREEDEEKQDEVKETSYDIDRSKYQPRYRNPRSGRHF